MTNFLSGGKVNIAQLQEHLREELLQLVDQCNGTKAIVWDGALAGPMGSIASCRSLKDRNVKTMFHLKHGVLPQSDVKNVIFITRPSLHLMDMVADNVHGFSGDRKECFLFFVPRRSQLCEKRLQSKGVFGNFTLIMDLPCDIFPVDNDLMSMEVDSAFKEYYVENDPTCLYQVAQAVMTLQGLYGVIPKVVGKGAAALRVWELICKLSKEPRNFPSTLQIDQLLLIDRSVDLLSPVATQLTYEGLIDEIFEIQNSTAGFPADKLNMGDDDQNEVLSATKKVILNSGDEVFAEIRDKNFNAVGASLSKRAKLITAQLQEHHVDISMEKMKKFVNRLQHLMDVKKQIFTHTSIAHLIKEVTDSNEFLDSLQLEQELMLGVDTDRIQTHIEDCIANQQPLVKVLRLICLQSFTNSGLKPKVLEHYKRELLQTYGFHHVLTLSNLEKCGLLKIQQGSRSYTVLRKTLRLTVEDGSEIAPSDINYVHTVYAPLSVRLTQYLIKPGGWRQLSDVLSLLPGPTLDQTQAHSIPQNRRRGSIGSQSSAGDNSKVVLIFFIGGCTFAEISALRFLSQQEDSNVEFVIATTKLINGNSFIKSLMEPLDSSIV